MGKSIIILTYMWHELFVVSLASADIDAAYSQPFVDGVSGRVIAPNTTDAAAGLSPSKSSFANHSRFLFVVVHLNFVAHGRRVVNFGAEQLQEASTTFNDNNNNKYFDCQSASRPFDKRLSSSRQVALVTHENHSHATSADCDSIKVTQHIARMPFQWDDRNAETLITVMGFLFSL